jgi:hypothetical protein
MRPRDERMWRGRERKQKGSAKTKPNVGYKRTPLKIENTLVTEASTQLTPKKDIHTDTIKTKHKNDRLAEQSQ